MIAEESIYKGKPDISAKKGTSQAYIVKSIKDACAAFKAACNNPKIQKPLNENKLTQIFVEQVEVKIKANQFIGVKNQYSDIFYGSTGIPDFYFHKVEEGVSHEPLFVVEAKRLPSPTFETEYVKGQNNNGGIERFKTGKHGKGLTECAIVGFIEKETSDAWLKKINDWIKGLAKTDDKHWDKDEVLKELEKDTSHVYLNSIAYTKKPKKVSLHHIWVI